MNLQQLEYIVAVDRLRHFAKAAGYCNVTQPTLSAMIQKLEDELGLQIFDRTAHPVITNDNATEVIAQAKEVLQQVRILRDKANDARIEMKGELILGVIPTIAPYLMPLFLFDFLKQFPQVKVVIREFHTAVILEKIRLGELDAGIVATPLDENGFISRRLYLEPLKLYVSKLEEAAKNIYVLPTEIDASRIWMLEEGNCLRNQFINLCNLKSSHLKPTNLDYTAGNFETLVQMIDRGGGMTLLPELAIQQLNEDRKTQVREFTPPQPVREVSLVFMRQYAKQKINEALVNFVRDKMRDILPLQTELNNEARIIQI